MQACGQPVDRRRPTGVFEVREIEPRAGGGAIGQTAAMETGLATRVPVEPIDVRRLGPILGPERVEELLGTAAALRRLLDGRRVVNVNSTPYGGGVAEMLRTLVGYTLGAGLETIWLVIEGNPEKCAGVVHHFASRRGGVLDPAHCGQHTPVIGLGTHRHHENDVAH